MKNRNIIQKTNNAGKFVALILARGGSKGLPRKNILPLNGKPVISWTIEAALQCPQVGRVFVSTDDSEIATTSISLGAEIIDRPPALALDTSSSIDALSHAIDWLELNNIQSEYLVLLQPTSPLRNAVHLQESLHLYTVKNADLVISVFEPSHTPIKSYIEREDGSLAGLYSDDAPYTRRQDLPRAFQPNGAIYAFSKNAFKLNNRFPQSNVYPYLMSECDSLDIDTLDDLLAVEKVMMELSR
ncbi:acylneuraminate cytidylyltransferase family protein [Vibrio alfacsensis]|uniref:Acylneuraminate cytidylyltransferase family protein n=1 Tax=Vibrio alfacsensis TaxID=1074311 RepID=A0ABM6YXL7_9VIBR|nr:acylneuraminate cytidylyltransferase family protein [Vibrio alfacsensis]AXY02661.1 acylneuraminate cytidylyltransferase family protein [Vibrio alfacsensis]